MARSKIEYEYFEWMYDLVCGDDYNGYCSYRDLLLYLHGRRFTYIMRKDADRAADGLDLRYRFAYDTGCACADGYLDGPCSVLEMMIALAIRCEETIMDDPKMGDRTKQWFWQMVVNLGLGDMYDERFDDIYVKGVIDNFLKRKYEPDGRGGLFRIRHCDYDLRHVSIWHQLLWYLDSIS